MTFARSGGFVCTQKARRDMVRQPDSVFSAKENMARCGHSLRVDNEDDRSTVPGSDLTGRISFE